MVDQTAGQKLQPLDQPLGDAGIRERVENMPPLAAFPDQMVRPQNGKVLGDAGVADAENLLQTVDIDLSVVQFDQNAQTVRVRNRSQQFGELFGDPSAGRNGNLRLRKFSS